MKRVNGIEKVANAPRYYRYMPLTIDVMVALASGKVYMSDPMSLNDPFDVTPKFSNKDAFFKSKKMIELGNSLFGEKYKEILSEISYSVQGYLYEDDMNIDEKELFAKLLANRIWREVKERQPTKSIVCLSDRWKEPLLWSHYADSHKGICVEYAWLGNNQFMKGVSYSDDIEHIDIDLLYKIFIEGSDSDRGKLIDRYYFTKSKSWAYENEYRVISENEPNTLQDMQLVPIKIIFGLRTNNVLKDYLYRMFSDYSSDFPIEFYSLTQIQGYSFDKELYQSDESGYVPFWPREPSVLQAMHFDNNIAMDIESDFL